MKKSDITRTGKAMIKTADIQGTILTATRYLFFSMLIVFIQFSSFSSARAADTKNELETALVSEQILSREFRVDGVVEAIHKATISAQTEGTVQQIFFDVDDYVEKGALIIQLKDTSQQARLKKAQAVEKEAIAQLAKDEDEYKRIKDIYAKKVVSKAKMDEVTHAFTAAKARLESARAGLEEAREQLSYTRVTAPYSGIITERHVEAGENVQPGGKLVTGVSLDKLRVNVDVPQSLINRIRQYKKAYVYIKSWIGETLNRIAVEEITVFPVADAASNTFRVRLDLPHEIQGLFPGMYIEASLVTGEKPVLMVPKQSVVFRSELTAVYVIADDGIISFRHILAGKTSDDMQVVLSGLAVGEQVALDPIRAGIKLMQQRQQSAGR
jgi:RND family efflux transporter MFP subunit